MAKISKEKVAQIKLKLVETYDTQAQIGRDFGVTAQSVGFINLGKTHKDENTDYPIRKVSRHPSHLVVSKATKKLFRIISIQNALMENKKSMREISIEYKMDFSSVSRTNTGERNYNPNLTYPLRLTSQMLGDIIRAEYAAGSAKITIQEKYSLGTDALNSYLRAVKDED